MSEDLVRLGLRPRLGLGLGLGLTLRLRLRLRLRLGLRLGLRLRLRLRVSMAISSPELAIESRYFSECARLKFSSLYVELAAVDGLATPAVATREVATLQHRVVS